MIRGREREGRVMKGKSEQRDQRKREGRVIRGKREGRVIRGREGDIEEGYTSTCTCTCIQGTLYLVDIQTTQVLQQDQFYHHQY